MKPILKLVKLDVGYLIFWSDGILEYLTKFEVTELQAKAKEVM